MILTQVKVQKEWHSYGIKDKNPNYNVFLEAAKEHIEKIIND